MPSVLSYANAFPMDNVLARNFNGTSEFASAGATGSGAQTGLTVAWWVYLNALPASAFAGLITLSNPTWLFYVESNGTIAFQTGTVTAMNLVTCNPWPSASTLAVGQWYHMAVTGDGATVTLYINGAVNGTPQTVTSASGTNFGAAMFADDLTSTTRYVPCQLVDIAIWDVCLSAGQVLLLAHGARAASIATGLKNNWVMTGASPEPDSVGGANATLTGTSTLNGGPATLGLV